MAGFMEVTLVTAEELGLCTHYGTRKTVNAALLQQIRKWCFGLNTLCTLCAETGGLEGDVIEMCMLNGQTLSTFYIKW